MVNSQCEHGDKRVFELRLHRQLRLASFAMPASNDRVRLETTLRTWSQFPLIDSFSLQAEEFDFWRQQTGIEDADDLEQHIVKIQRDAYAVFPYGCIRYFSFLRCVLRVSFTVRDMTVISAIFQLEDRQCAGLRQSDQIGGRASGGDPQVGSYDMIRLFRSNAETFPAVFLPGDIFDTTHLAPASIDGVNDRALAHRVPSLRVVPPLKSLTSLNALRGHVAAIHAGAFFHLFSEERQTGLARALASLLSSEPGSMIVGWQAGAPHNGVRVITRAPDHSPRATSPALSQFCHSPESWAELWDGARSSRRGA
ncbi:hypothetical protein LXA43DRAFT_1022713 [Ganoderma leucocontextum]|nr:hypothetical protein LXA43DRAFT_1022713 [Ganoderma leucocontextum]